MPVTFCCWQNWLLLCAGCKVCRRFVLSRNILLFINCPHVQFLSLPLLHVRPAVTHSGVSLSVPLRRVPFLHSHCSPDCYFHGHAVSHNGHPCVTALCLSVTFLVLIQYGLIPFGLVSLTFILVIDSFLYLSLKFRPFSLYSSRCISPHFPIFCPSYCSPFDTERYAMFC